MADDDLLAELVALRRGRGVQEPGVAGRLGPELLRLSGVRAGDADGPARAGLVTALAALAADLPWDLRQAAESALGSGDQPATRLVRRTEQLAARLHCSERTARRRMDDALALMSAAVRRRPERPEGAPVWHRRAHVRRPRRPGAYLDLTVNLRLPPRTRSGDRYVLVPLPPGTARIQVRFGTRPAGRWRPPAVVSRPGVDTGVRPGESVPPFGHSRTA